MPFFSSSLQFADAVLQPLTQLAPELNAARAAGLSREQSLVRYPARLTRYLLPYAWMTELRQQLGRPLRVTEIGTGSGQMKRFTDFLAAQSATQAPFYERWLGLDIAPQMEKLTKAGYEQVETFNADEPLQRNFSGVDVVLLLHVLEHLRQPEEFVRQLAGALDRGAVILGGVPSVPDCLRAMREARLRQKYLPGGHWCKFSPGRIRHLVQMAGLRQLELTGAFILRASGSVLENRLGWMRWNLALARAFPGWPGEIYFRATVVRGS